jgi:hypothetical protein
MIDTIVSLELDTNCSTRTAMQLSHSQTVTCPEDLVEQKEGSRAQMCWPFEIEVGQILFSMCSVVPVPSLGVKNNLSIVLNVNIDLSGLLNLANLDDLKRIGELAAANLALLTQAKVEELAGQRLHSRLAQFREGLSPPKQDDSGVWVIHLDDEQAWINDGYAAHSMIPDLLNSPKAKMAADGSKYMVIPFSHTAGKSGPTQTTPAQQDLVVAIKKQLNNQKIPWGKVEKDSSGMPILGRVHKLNLQTPNKMREAMSGHGRQGMGWGNVGEKMVGATGIGFLEGAAVHQSLSSKGKVERSVMTFRIASSKHEAQGRWQHPGLEPTHIFEDAYEWALKEIDLTVMPSIMKEIEALGKS